MAQLDTSIYDAVRKFSEFSYNVGCSLNEIVEALHQLQNRVDKIDIILEEKNIELPAMRADEKPENSNKNVPFDFLNENAYEYIEPIFEDQIDFIQ